MTYSFPCTNLSLAGKQKGMARDSNTSSSLLWEVERILNECNELPQILLMENVPMVISQKFFKDFREWQMFLEGLGYSNYFELLNAKNYGIPQNRNRCFMVSILGDYNYKFPKPIKLKLRLKDMLEEEVDEKYYLSDAFLNYCLGINQKPSKFPRGDRFRANIFRKNQDIAVAITTNPGNRATDNFIIEKSLFTELDAQMITEDGNVKRYINSDIVDKFEEGDSADISFPNGYNKGNRVYKGIIPAINGTTVKNFITKTEKLRIRKLTPLEIFKLMGFSDEDFSNAAKVNSDSQLFKQAGNSIVVQVLEAIFKELL